MVGQLPSGTVTFLFTDVESSTRLLEELGAERFAEELERHRVVVREALEAHGGTEVDTQGDAFFCAFSSARAAVACAESIQAALDGGAIRIRIGIHTGEALLAGDRYVGLDVHRAARIGATGHGGQVVISPATRQLLEPGSFELADLGAHRLKDLSEPVTLYQLGHADFAPLKTLFRTNLPVPATPFLGREAELEELVGRLTQTPVRLLTRPARGEPGRRGSRSSSRPRSATAFPTASSGCRLRRSPIRSFSPPRLRRRSTPRSGPASRWRTRSRGRWTGSASSCCSTTASTSWPRRRAWSRRSSRRVRTCSC